MGIFFIGSFSIFITADMSPPYNMYSHSTFGAIILISEMNFFINLFWLSLIIFLLRRIYGNKISPIYKIKQFVPLLFLNTVFITALGAIVDLYFLYEIKENRFYLYFNGINWFVAALIIFIIVSFICISGLRIQPKLSFLIGSIFAGLNFILWFFIENRSIGTAIYVPFVLLGIIMFSLLIWDMKKSQKNLANLKKVIIWGFICIGVGLLLVYLMLSHNMDWYMYFFPLIFLISGVITFIIKDPFFIAPL